MRVKWIWTATVVLLTIAGGITLRRHHGVDRADNVATPAAESVVNHPADTLPAGFDPRRENKGVGWVFGRLSGIADAPGSWQQMPVGPPSAIHPSDSPHRRIRQ